MSMFFTSDQHYGHRNICKYAGRPFSSVEEMDEVLITNHNAVVGNGDPVWFLGDFAFATTGRIKQLLSRLNGQKNIILGNHDKGLRNVRKELLAEKLVNGIFDYREITWQKQHIVLAHYGHRVWNRSHHGSWMLYGHSHGTLPPYGKSADMGVDSKVITDEYRPYSFEEVKCFMDAREISQADRH